jgi:transcriptional regulator GlxA family with amidase domain
MRSIAIAIFSNVQALDVVGPLDVFAEANCFVADGEGYVVSLIGQNNLPLNASNGMKLQADLTFKDAVKPFDTALIAGGPNLPISPPEKNLIDWIIHTAPLCNRYGSICTGTFALGHAGLLKNKHVTTHWQNALELAKQFPEAKVDLDSIYIRDANLLTSAGVTAGIDAALAIVSEDHGPSISLAVAKRLLVFAQRRGGQSQFSPYLIAAIGETSPIARVQQFVMNNLHQKFTVEKMASYAGMSSRNFARLFVQISKITPHEFIDRARVDHARRLLESSNLPLKTVAFECGFLNAERMRIVFTKRLGTTPNDYRKSFNKL